MEQGGGQRWEVGWEALPMKPGGNGACPGTHRGRDKLVCQEAKEHTFTCKLTSPRPQDNETKYELLSWELRGVSPGKEERGVGRTLASIPCLEL